MPHCRLRRPRRHPALAQQRPERVPQGVNVEDAVALVPLGDAGGLQVAVENLRQLIGNVEHLRGGRQAGRDRLARLLGVTLDRGELLGETRESPARVQTRRRSSTGGPAANASRRMLRTPSTRLVQTAR